MLKKTKISNNQRVKLSRPAQDIHPHIKIIAEKKEGLMRLDRDLESCIKESPAITKLKDQIQKLEKEHEDDIKTIIEHTKSHAKQEELLKNEKNAHVSRIKESESKIQMLTNRCDELAAQLNDAQAKYHECQKALISKEEHGRVLQEELSRTQWSLGEEKEFRRQAEEALRRKQADLERHQDEMRNFSHECNSLRKELSECQWHLGEERALKQRAETSLGESAAYIELQKNDLNQKQSVLDIVTKQSQESQWHLGEARAKIKTLEEQLSSENKRAEGLSGQISIMQEAFAKSNLLAAEWMRRWDRLIEETLKGGGEIDREQIEKGKFWERQLSLSRQEIEVLTAKQTELEKQLKQSEGEAEYLNQVNASLQKDLLAERQKYQALEKNYSESEWYLNEARAETQKIQGATC
jgi:chromosome segregation ATPase